MREEHLEEEQKLKDLMKKQMHFLLAKYDESGKLTDECGRCGLNFRDPIHRRFLKGEAE
jgi:hypothetical protein